MNHAQKTGPALVAATLICLAAPAFAADLPAPPADPVASFEPWSPWQVRLRALGVFPEDGGSVSGVAGSDLSYSNSVTPELDISYYFTPNIAVELILGTTYASVDGEGSIAALGEVGNSWILPPTLTLQYHFTNFGAFQPYVGAGVNYTIFYGTEAKSLSAFEIENTFGLALQAGADYMLNEHWGLNLDVKKIFLEPDWNGRLANGTAVKGKAEMNPWLIGAGVTYRF
ncbi:OmpW family protein [Afifella sp. IM 167]|uniref:OmpW/AlkL family protein n=1 Tax=Afifella sp. IM 167 TaxID=2033586 RepID=UPI001CCF0D88|nr:OmpW family protein [Afifella sp. IM 167]MBZ8133666.1 hypothetical protein [Afifella sp. IM 167]